MIPDQSMYLMDAVAISSATTTVSSVLDNLAARMIGSGTPIHLLVSLLGIAPGGTSPTLSVELFGADDVGMSTNKISIGKVTIPLVSGQVVVDNWEIGLPSRAPKRFYRAEAVSGGTSPTMTIDVFFTLDAQTSPPLVGA